MDVHSVLYTEKRRILIVEDEAINREILSEILEQEYEVICAVDGVDALEKLQENKEFLSLVLLDLIMPKMSGIEVLRRIRSSSEYQDIPVIVASGDQSREIECLNTGASDFIQKPYPESGVIVARVRRAIELFEGRRIIESTERDHLTDLYNREYFYGYAEQFDRVHPNTEMDAILIDINNFRAINERYGRAYADDVLRKVASILREVVHAEGGIVCRREADIFLIYCPHREDYKAILDKVTTGLSENLDPGNRIRLRMGVYSRVDKTLDIERRFDRAKMAADTVRSSYTRNIGVYDDTLYKAELYSMQLIEDFPAAIEEHQFKVYYQPKFDIRPDKPVLGGAEALVRWMHPEFGMVSPGVFIPLFEDNGLIGALDHYVWREAARQVREWKDTLGVSVPVSVNVSRVDLDDPEIVYTLLSITEEFKLEPRELHLEVTESAYAEDQERIIKMVKHLRAMTFLVEMDDFGTGYSSLNMLSTLPIDVLKLDMKFIQTAFSEKQDTDMISIIIEIARHLSAPVVAEGVETEEQMNALRALGCDYVQGYYFSPPVPAEKFAPFLVEKKDTSKEYTESDSYKKKTGTNRITAAFQRWSRRINIPLRSSSLVFLIVAILLAAAIFVGDVFVTRGYKDMEKTSENFIKTQQATTNLELGSDELTSSVKSFVVTGDLSDMEEYFREAEVTRRRDNAVADMKVLLADEESEVLDHLSVALSLSNELMELEYKAMKLAALAGGCDMSEIPEAVRDYPLSPEEIALSPAEKQALAIELVYGPVYKEYKAGIKENTAYCTEKLISETNESRMEANQRENRLLALQTVLLIVFFVVILIILFFINIWIRRPLNKMVEQMKAKTTVDPAGAEELRFVSETYNEIFEENRKTNERLAYGNMHDSLTGLFNRNAYDFMKLDLDMSQNALLLADVDKFKSVNDTYGHEVGDLVLQRVAEVLKYCFRSTDLIFRPGGDEFVVIISNVSSSMKDQVRSMIEQANVMLQKPTDDLPPVSLSAGVAFSDRENPEGDIFNDADTALYRMKEAGRCGCYIY